MNIDVKYWLCNKLGEMCECTIDMAQPKDNIIYFNKKKKDAFSLQSVVGDKLPKIMIASIFLVMVISMLNTSFSNAEKPIVNYVNIKVASGDTVWTIAARNASKKEDIRELVYAIKTMNNLDQNAAIYSGQMLKVPTQSVQ